MPRNINPVPQFFDSAGDPLVGGQMFYFDSGTNDELDTFADVNETVKNTHPVILTADGRLPNVFFSVAAKQILKDSDGVEIWERDPVVAGSGTGEGFAPDFDAITIYEFGDTVNVSDILFRSIISSNQNNNPTTTPTAWSEFDLLNRWNVNETYQSGDPVTQSSQLYISLTSSNTGNDPDSDATNWQPTTTKMPTTQNFTASGTWNRPVGCKWTDTQVVGPGGGGTGVSTATPAVPGLTGGGGGGGGYARGIIDVTSTSSVTVTIGTGGAGGAAGGLLDGSDGSGPSSFGTLLIGNEGEGATVVVSADEGGAGGTGGGTDFYTTITGGGGGHNSSEDQNGGDGGGTPFSPVTKGDFDAGANNGAGPGGGGSGAVKIGSNSSEFAGGNGANGRCIVIEYY